MHFTSLFTDLLHCGKVLKAWLESASEFAGERHVNTQTSCGDCVGCASRAKRILLGLTSLKTPLATTYMLAKLESVELS